MSPIERHGPIEEIAPNVTVETELRGLIEKEGLLTFAEFMDNCLYSP